MFIYNLLNIVLVFSINLLLTIIIKEIPKVKNLIGG